MIRLTAQAGATLALYGDNWSYPRMFAWLPLGVWLACVQLRWRWPLVALAAPGGLPLAVLVRVWSGAASWAVLSRCAVNPIRGEQDLQVSPPFFAAIVEKLAG